LEELVCAAAADAMLLLTWFTYANVNSSLTSFIIKSWLADSLYFDDTIDK